MIKDPTYMMHTTAYIEKVQRHFSREARGNQQMDEITIEPCSYSVTFVLPGSMTSIISERKELETDV